MARLKKTLALFPALPGAPVPGTAGADTLTGGNGTDDLRGGGGNDYLNGGAGHDYLYGETGNDTIHGAGGNDIIAGGNGQDNILGGSGNDLIFALGDGDTIDGGADSDTISYAQAGFGVTVDLLGGFAEARPTAGSAVRDTIRNVENVIGSDLDDFIRGSDGANALYGLNGDDDMTGEGGNDSLYGGEGNDRISGDQGYYSPYDSDPTGNDYLDGGAGNDSLFGGWGSDTLIGGAGDDFLNGSQGADVLYGGAGRDKIGYYYSDIGVTINLATGHASGGDAAGDVFSGIEDVTGSVRSDSLTGDNQANLLEGLSGNDTLIGAGGHDTLIGGRGNDVIIGGAGQDVLTGDDPHVSGRSSDRFVFRAVSDSTVNAMDVITDFHRSSRLGAVRDIIDLREIDANSARVRDQAFSFIADNAFTGRAGELRYWTTQDTTYLEADVNGDGRADFAVQINGVHELAATDFLL